MNTIIIKKHFFLVVIILIPGIVTKAQIFSIGAKTGLMNSKFVSNSSNSSRNVFYFGAVANKRLSRTYSIQTEINYSSYGSNTNGLQQIPGSMYDEFNLSINTIYYGSFKKKTILSNIQILLFAKVTLPIYIHFKYYILLGPYISYLANAKNITSGTGMIYQDITGQIPATIEDAEINEIPFNNVWNATNDFRKFNIGAVGGIGFSYGHPCRSIRIFIEGRFGINISNIHKRESLRTDKNQT